MAFIKEIIITNLYNKLFWGWVYPDECNFWKLHTIKVDGKQQTSHIVVQMNAVNTIKAATKIKDPDLYNETVYLDLFAKEFLSTIQNAMIVLHMGTAVQ